MGANVADLVVQAAPTMEASQYCIEVAGVTKRFWLERDRATTVSGFILSTLRLTKRRERLGFLALRDISFKVAPGETIGIIGANGSGKSTLLKLMAGIYTPTSGSVTVTQRMASLLELGTGFNIDLTGRENIYLNASLLGRTRREIQRQFDAIIEFADVRDFIDTPLKHYSSGMKMRLGFAIAAHLDAEIMLLDEILAVGDEQFQKKCIARLRQFQAAGRTLCIVSHSLNHITELCTRVIWLSRGMIMDSGPTETVVN